MTYSHTYNSFVLEGDNGSYDWSTENWDEAAFSGMSLAECAEEARKEAKIQLAIAIEHIEADFLQSEDENEDGEPLVRNRTFAEVTDELTEDVPHLETHLYWWMVEAGGEPQDDPTEGGIAIGELYQPEDDEDGEDDEEEPFGVETALKLIRIHREAQLGATFYLHHEE